MTIGIDLPLDAMHDSDVAADYLELLAAFSSDGQSSPADIVNAADIEAESEYHDVDEEMRGHESIADAALRRIATRLDVLEEAYPFELDFTAGILSLDVNKLDLPGTAYVLSLLLANLRSVSPLLQDFERYPSPDEVDAWRRWFQYYATAAVAGEIGGSAWSFGFPRPDGSGFIAKLEEIWRTLKDGRVSADASAPSSPKDGEIDVLAWKETRDGLPGFLLVAAQVATGADWKSKSIKRDVNSVFKNRWFAKRQPVTEMIAYHVIPFALADEGVRDDVLVVGNLLHRLRVPRRVADASTLVSDERISVEAFEELNETTIWMRTYIAEARAA
ncbi:MAG: hypothetical protein F4164_03095 [Gemmatimonadales bacterium]|nr:hypothetical protein [Gemmatimonadales bacterium]MYG48363.1 hypothetical protein [Gemmatimonadales bacterium]MYK01689.1 hypothetical protein [Candidatus Palauibacter ramosifaciens]